MFSIEKQGFNFIVLNLSFDLVKFKNRIRFIVPMNEIDKQWLKTLRYFADNTRAQINARKETFPDEYPKNVPKDLEDTFAKFSYLDLHGNTKHIITQSGLQQLRDLEQVYQKDISYKIAIASIIISALAFAKSMGWLDKLFI